MVISLLELCISCWRLTPLMFFQRVIFGVFMFDQSYAFLLGKCPREKS